MPHEYLVVCDSAEATPAAALPKAKVNRERIRLHEPGANARLRLGQVCRVTWQSIPPVLQDLAEVASYVYLADRQCRRGVESIDDGWRRRLHFRIPVRLPDLWNHSDVSEALERTLAFLTEDEYFFEFQPQRKLPPFESHLEFGGQNQHGEEVILFSGGADSLSAASRQVIRERRRVVLLHHRSNFKPQPVVENLARELARIRPDCAPTLLSVEVHRTGKQADPDPFQRSRSFLFACLGALVAQVNGLQRVLLCDNGVISVNLPLAGPVVGARASRTTHPRFLRDCSSFLTRLLGEGMAIINPLQRLTRTQVLQQLRDCGAAPLLALSRSCAYPRHATNEQPHCGVCTQCLDRRLAVLAADLQDHDPTGGYRVELFEGERPASRDQNLLAAYLASVDALDQMDEAAFCARYGELTRVLPYLDQAPALAAHQAYLLHRQHAQEVWGVVDRELSRRARQWRRGQLQAGTLLGMVTRDQVGPSSPVARTTAAPCPEPDYLFRREGNCWRVRFAGGPSHVFIPERGLDYLHILVGQPNRPISAAQLVQQVVGLESTQPSGDLLLQEGLESVQVRDCPNGALPLADDLTLKAYHTRLVDLREELDEAQRNNDEATLMLCTQEVDELRKELRRNNHFTRTAKELQADRKNLVGAVGNAIRRALKTFRNYAPPLAEHFTREVLRCGACPCYCPPADVEWQT
jgi:7-cyano-7-deazaguanine synthase in queuosine biosynthesis